MTVGNLVSRTTPPLRLSDTVEYALGMLVELRVHGLPVIDDEENLVGLISEEQLLDAASPELTLRDIIGGRPVSALPENHVFDVTRRMVQQGLSMMPIAEEDGHYVGVVKRHDIFEQFARMLSTQENGAILALEIDPRDYSLAKLIHTIEQNDVKVLSVASEPPDTPEGSIRLTLKLNVTDASRVRHVLEHFGYHVVASFGEAGDDEELLHRVQEFMRYLEV